MVTSPAKAIVEFTEGWWRDPLSAGLVAKIRDAPFAHLQAFFDAWPTDIPAHPELTKHFVPRLAPGKLRPALQGADLSALLVLLYTDSVLLSSQFLSPLHNLRLRRMGHFPVSKRLVREGIEVGFTQLAELKPLIDLDLVYFTNLTAVPYQYSEYLSGEWPRARYGPPDSGSPPTGLRRQEAIEDRASALHAIQLLFDQRVTTPVALNSIDAQVIASWRSNSSVDMRGERVATLARISCPELRISLTDLAKLRSDEDLFANWRSVLGKALSAVGAFEPTLAAAREARAVVGEELADATQTLRKGVARSTWMSRLRSGLRGFSLGAFSTAGTLVFDDSDLWTKAKIVTIGGLIGGGIEAVRPGINEVGQARLIDRLVLDFRLRH